MDFEAGDLLIEGDNYYVQHKKPFRPYGFMLEQDKIECFDFAYNMSYGLKGEHRDHRSGGTMHRTKGQVFINTLQGKMAEYALYRYFEEHQIIIEKPDTSEYELGKWDSFDLECQGKHISVKSTKSRGDLLLLETRDWNEKGEYIPNCSLDNAKYDYTVLVRFDIDGEALMRQHRLLYQKDEQIPDNIKDMLLNLIIKPAWAYDFPGFIYYTELVKMINEKRIIPRNAMLNGTTKMDADNFYFQSGKMHPIKDMYTYDKDRPHDGRESIRLKRTCPKCGKSLVIKRGYNLFWGCEGFFDVPKCEFKERMEYI